MRKQSWRILAWAILALLLALVWVAERAGWLSGGSPARVLTLYCFSTLQDVMQERLVPAFQERWYRDRRQRVEFAVTYAGSGEITDLLLRRFPAEIAIVASEIDAYRLPVPFESWRQLPAGGTLARTPVVIVVRDGNPLGITGFTDLARSGLEVVHSDPEISGAAMLAFLAEHRAALAEAGDPDGATRLVVGLWRNVKSPARSAREARVRFAQGSGDALVTYEHDVSQGRVPGDIVYPPITVLAEPVVVAIDKNIETRRRVVADAFLDFLWTRTAQLMLVEYGFRSVQEELNQPDPPAAASTRSLTLEQLGGAGAARREILEGVWRRKVLPELDGPALPSSSSTPGSRAGADRRPPRRPRSAVAGSPTGTSGG